MCCVCWGIKYSEHKLLSHFCFKIDNQIPMQNTIQRTIHFACVYYLTSFSFRFFSSFFFQISDSESISDRVLLCERIRKMKMSPCTNAEGIMFIYFHFYFVFASLLSLFSSHLYSRPSSNGVNILT